MRLLELVFFGTLILAPIHSASAQARGAAGAPGLLLTEPSMTRPVSERRSAVNKGVWWAELSGAVIGDLLATVLTTAIIAPLYCDDSGGGSCSANHDILFGVGLGAGFTGRVLAVGGLTAACARPSGGQGASWAAMLGAMPGAALIFGSWYVDQDLLGAGLLMGHIGTVVGAVVAYRASARRRHTRDSLFTKLIPAPTLERGRNAGLSWHGTF